MAQSAFRIASRSFGARCTGQCLQRRNYFATATLRSTEDSKLPRVANPSFWSSLVPRPLRRTSDPAEAAERARRRAVGAGERRVGIIFLILGILVGSNAIQIIAIKRQTLDFSRKTDAKLELLREVVQRVKNGEDVDVKKVLGTGDPEHEKEWEEVMKELESPDMLWESTSKKEAKRLERTVDQRSKDRADKVANQTEPEGASDRSDSSSTSSRPKFLL